jgi:excisionase family DNA binding protein
MEQQAQSNANTLERLLDEKEAAEICHFSKRGLEELRKAGRIPHIKLGRSIRYNAASLRAYLARMERGGI